MSMLTESKQTNCINKQYTDIVFVCLYTFSDKKSTYPVFIQLGSKGRSPCDLLRFISPILFLCLDLPSRKLLWGGNANCRKSLSLSLSVCLNKGLWFNMHRGSVLFQQLNNFLPRKQLIVKDMGMEKVSGTFKEADWKYWFSFPLPLSHSAPHWPKIIVTMEQWAANCGQWLFVLLIKPQNTLSLLNAFTCHDFDILFTKNKTKKKDIIGVKCIQNKPVV